LKSGGKKIGMLSPPYQVVAEGGERNMLRVHKYRESSRSVWEGMELEKSSNKNNLRSDQALTQIPKGGNLK